MFNQSKIKIMANFNEVPAKKFNSNQIIRQVGKTLYLKEGVKVGLGDRTRKIPMGPIVSIIAAKD